jgi:hypothetical protein
VQIASNPVGAHPPEIQPMVGTQAQPSLDITLWKTPVASTLLWCATSYRTHIDR